MILILVLNNCWMFYSYFSLNLISCFPDVVYILVLEMSGEVEWVTVTLLEIFAILKGKI